MPDAPPDPTPQGFVSSPRIAPGIFRLCYSQVTNLIIKCAPNELCYDVLPCLVKECAIEIHK